MEIEYVQRPERKKEIRSIKALNILIRSCAVAISPIRLSVLLVIMPYKVVKELCHKRKYEALDELVYPFIDFDEWLGGVYESGTQEIRHAMREFEREDNEKKKYWQEKIRLEREEAERAAFEAEKEKARQKPFIAGMIQALNTNVKNSGDIIYMGYSASIKFENGVSLEYGPYYIVCNNKEVRITNAELEVLTDAAKSAKEKLSKQEYDNELNSVLKAIGSQRVKD